MKHALDSIKQHYYGENLSLPALVSWPLNTEAEAQRIQNQKRFHENLQDGIAPGLVWMEGHKEAKYRPDLVLEGCKSVLISHLGYYRQDSVDGDARLADGKVARYARGRDYHKELGLRLRRICRAMENDWKENTFKSFTDTGPLDEVWLAQVSGAGFRGRHGLAIFPRVGSWSVAGYILTTLDFKDDRTYSVPVACPKNCRRCIDACPSNALMMPGRLKHENCISYQTIEHKGPVPEEDAALWKNWIFGCDECQQACPYNAAVPLTEVDAFIADKAGATLNLAEIMNIRNHNDMIRMFAGSALMRAGRAGLVRNACIVAANSGRKDLIPLLEGLVADGDVGVRAAAGWALNILAGQKSARK